ncbi:MAG: hypothetical protein ACJA01_002120 [Saprospiraceae bacterium]|jgi:hypothetical protein
MDMNYTTITRSKNMMYLNPRSMNQARLTRGFAIILFLGSGWISGFGETASAVTCLCDGSGSDSQNYNNTYNTVVIAQ